MYRESPIEKAMKKYRCTDLSIVTHDTMNEIKLRKPAHRR